MSDVPHRRHPSAVRRDNNKKKEDDASDAALHNLIDAIDASERSEQQCMPMTPVGLFFSA